MAAWFLSFLIAAAEPQALPPVDQCASDPSFVQFRERLREAIAARDSAHLLSVVADDIRISFGDTGGREDFVRMWELGRPATSRLWDELGEALRLGCAPSEDGSFWAPSLGQQLSEEEDPFSVVVAVRTGAVLREAPYANAAAVAPLAWDVLTVQPDDGADEWLPVTMRDGRSGFVHSSDVRSPLDYRAGFEKRGGSWRMITFVAGD
jgi:hypothetical protein